MKRLGLLLCLILPFAALPAPAQQQDIVVKKDIVYGKGGNEDLMLNLAVPKGDGPFPAVVCVHGGGWKAGTPRGPGFDGRGGVEYVGALVANTPTIVAADAFSPAPVAGDAAHRTTITGPCKVHWKDGVQRIVEFWEPLIRDGRSALDHHAAAQKAVA